MKSFPRLFLLPTFLMYDAAHRGRDIVHAPSRSALEFAQNE